MPLSASTTPATGLSHTKSIIRSYALEYGVSEEIMNKVIACESSYNPKAYNGKDNHAKSIGSHGIAQFSRETFAYYSKEAGIEDGDPYDEDAAIETLAYMLSIGQGRHWTCFRRL